VVDTSNYNTFAIGWCLSKTLLAAYLRQVSSAEKYYFDMLRVLLRYVLGRPYDIKDEK